MFFLFFFDSFSSIMNSFSSLHSQQHLLHFHYFAFFFYSRKCLGLFCVVFLMIVNPWEMQSKNQQKKNTPNMMKMLGAFTILYASSVKWFGFTVYCYCYIAFYSKFPNQSKVCVSYCCLVWICGLDGDYMSVFEYVFKFHIFCMTMASDTQQQQQKETREE